MVYIYIHSPASAGGHVLKTSCWNVNSTITYFHLFVPNRTSLVRIFQVLFVFKACVAPQGYNHRLLLFPTAIVQSAITANRKKPCFFLFCAHISCLHVSVLQKNPDSSFFQVLLVIRGMTFDRIVGATSEAPWAPGGIRPPSSPVYQGQSVTPLLTGSSQWPLSWKRAAVQAAPLSFSIRSGGVCQRHILYSRWVWNASLSALVWSVLRDVLWRANCAAIGPSRQVNLRGLIQMQELNVSR